MTVMIGCRTEPVRARSGWKKMSRCATATDSNQARFWHGNGGGRNGPLTLAKATGTLSRGGGADPTSFVERPPTNYGDWPLEMFGCRSNLSENDLVTSAFWMQAFSPADL